MTTKLSDDSQLIRIYGPMMVHLLYLLYGAFMSGVCVVFLEALADIELTFNFQSPFEMKTKSDV